MGVTFKGNTFNVLANTLDQKREVVIETTREIVDDLLENSVDFGRGVIDTTPSSIVRGKDNRNDTRTMRDAVSFKPMESVGSKRWRGASGWTGPVEDYFVTQEYGGVATDLDVGNRVISPMHMLTKMRIELAQELRTRLVAEFGA